MAKKIKIVETNTLPKCPHCKKDMETVETNTNSAFSGLHMIFMCPHCKTAIGASFAYNI